MPRDVLTRAPRPLLGEAFAPGGHTRASLPSASRWFAAWRAWIRSSSGGPPATCSGPARSRCVIGPHGRWPGPRRKASGDAP
jgi:hypothetical protein